MILKNSNDGLDLELEARILLYVRKWNGRFYIILNINAIEI